MFDVDVIALIEILSELFDKSDHIAVINLIGEGV